VHVTSQYWNTVSLSTFTTGNSTNNIQPIIWSMYYTGQTFNFTIALNMWPHFYVSMSYTMYYLTVYDIASDSILTWEISKQRHGS